MFYEIEVGGNIYIPQMIPVDYCGTLVYRVSIHFEDGRYAERSSLQYDGAADDTLEQMLGDLAQLCRDRYEDERVLPQEIYKRK